MSEISNTCAALLLAKQTRRWSVEGLDCADAIEFRFTRYSFALWGHSAGTSGVLRSTLGGTLVAFARLLKEPFVGKNIPTVAKFSQGSKRLRANSAKLGKARLSKREPAGLSGILRRSGNHYIRRVGWKGPSPRRRQLRCGVQRQGRFGPRCSCGHRCSGWGTFHVAFTHRHVARCIHAFTHCHVARCIHALPRCTLHPRIATLHGARHTAHVASPAAGEVVKFASAACESMCAAGANVLLEGRAQTLQRGRPLPIGICPPLAHIRHNPAQGPFPLSPMPPKAHSHLRPLRCRPIPSGAL